MGAGDNVSSCEMHVSRTDSQAAAWNNPPWLSNRKDSQTQRMKSCQVAKSLPTGKKTSPVLCWRRMRRKRESFLPSKSLIKNRAKHSGEGKDGPVPKQTQQGWADHLLLQFNFKAMTESWCESPSCFVYLVWFWHTWKQSWKSQHKNVLLCWWGQSSCKHILGQFRVSPSLYSCTNTAPSCQGIRSAETLTCLRLSSITIPRSTKLREMCLKDS